MDNTVVFKSGDGNETTILGFSFRNSETNRSRPPQQDLRTNSR